VKKVEGKDFMSEEQDQAYRDAGQQLRAARVASGLSQEALAMEANVDQSTLSKLERLGPQVMGWRKLEALAEALGCIVRISIEPSERS
jgi:transcriptional regulator with XRE-family HTH domain